MSAGLRARAEALLGHDEPMEVPPWRPIIRDLLATLPPDPAPTTREPCGAWREFHPGAFVLDGCALPRFTVCKRACSLRWCWYSAGEEPTEADDCRSAMLAAEDAADALLLAGRRALGRIK